MLCSPLCLAMKATFSVSSISVSAYLFGTSAQRQPRFQQHSGFILGSHSRWLGCWGLSQKQQQTDRLAEGQTHRLLCNPICFYLCHSREPLVMTPVREEMRPPVSQVTTKAEGPWIVPSDAWIFFAAGAEQGLL